MPGRSRWPNEEMWQEAVRLRESGLTYGDIAGRLAKKFNLEHVPTQETVRRHVTQRLSVKAAAPDRADPFFVGQQFRVWEGGDKTSYVRAVSVEPIADSMGSTVNLGPLAPEQSVVKLAVEILGLEDDELVRYRILVLEDVQVTLEELRPRRSPKQKGIKRMVDAFTKNSDPTLESTLFWLYGTNHELLIGVFNPTKYEQRLVNISFYGWRIRTEPVEGPAVNENVVEAITRGWN